MKQSMLIPEDIALDIPESIRKHAITGRSPADTITQRLMTWRRFRFAQSWMCLRMSANIASGGLQISSRSTRSHAKAHCIISLHEVIQRPVTLAGRMHMEDPSQHAPLPHQGPLKTSAAIRSLKSTGFPRSMQSCNTLLCRHLTYSGPQRPVIRGRPSSIINSKVPSCRPPGMSCNRFNSALRKFRHAGSCTCISFLHIQLHDSIKVQDQSGRIMQSNSQNARNLSGTGHAVLPGKKLSIARNQERSLIRWYSPVKSGERLPRTSCCSSAW